MSIEDKVSIGVVAFLITFLLLFLGVVIGIIIDTRYWQQQAVKFDHAYFDPKTKEFHWRHVESYLESTELP